VTPPGIEWSGGLLSPLLLLSSSPPLLLSSSLPAACTNGLGPSDTVARGPEPPFAAAAAQQARCDGRVAALLPALSVVLRSAGAAPRRPEKYFWVVLDLVLISNNVDVSAPAGQSRKPRITRSTSTPARHASVPKQSAVLRATGWFKSPLMPHGPPRERPHPARPAVLPAISAPSPAPPRQHARASRAVAPRARSERGARATLSRAAAAPIAPRAAARAAGWRRRPRRRQQQQQHHARRRAPRHAARAPAWVARAAALGRRRPAQVGARGPARCVQAGGAWIPLSSLMLWLFHPFELFEAVAISSL
jgi:hypothetical protein